MIGGFPKIKIETTQTLDTMLHQILNQALVAIGATAGSLMLVDARQGILQIKARLGEPRPDRVTERVFRLENESIAGWVVRKRRSYRCGDVGADPHFAASRSVRNFASLLAVPIVHEGHVVAVINADASDRDYFREDHQRRLESVAEQVAGPIAERISIIDALAEVGLELARLPKEGGVERALRKISELAVRSLGADVVTVYQYVQDRDEFLVEGTGPTIGGAIDDRFPMRRKVYPGDVPWTVVKERRSGFYSDVQQHDFLMHDVDRPDSGPRPRFAVRERVQSMAALLLPFRAAEQQDEEVVGAMFANYRSRHEFNIDEVKALATFADYAAVAILNARHEEQRHADQMRMVEGISATLAHRMSNLAGPSRLAAQLLREQVSRDDELAQRQLDQIEHEADRLMELAGRLVRRVKETGSIVKVMSIPIGPLVEDELQRLVFDADRVRVDRRIAPDLPRVESDEDQLRQVLHDILSNALEAVADLQAGRVEVVVRANPDTERVEVEISDNGIGIPEDVRDRLFTPGISTKRHSLGIGLWYSRTFMQATGGDVVLSESVPGERTTFVVEVPYAHDERADVTGRPAPTKQTADVLIVDDIPGWRDMLRDVVAAERCSIRTADGYADALEALGSIDFKLVILDIRLTEADEQNRDGLRLLQYLDELKLDTWAIVATVHPEDLDREMAERSPRLLAFMDKRTLETPRLRQLVRRALREPVRDRVHG